MLVSADEDALVAETTAHPDLPQQRRSRTGGRSSTANQRGASRSGISVGVLSGYLFGVIGFYTNFFETLLQATAVLLDVLVVLLAGALWARRSAVLRTSRPRVVLSAVAVLALVGLANVYGFAPPKLVHVPGSESCVYSVLSTDGTAIPIGPGGSATQEFQPRSDELNSVSVIIGIDEHTATLNRPHPISLRIWSEDLQFNRTLRRPDIVNNAFSRFDLSEPVRLRKPNGQLHMQVVNDSSEPIGVYVKQPGATEIANGIGDGVVIRGQVDSTAEHRVKGFALSGCVTRPT
jgi:hypothetical protein